MTFRSLSYMSRSDETSCNTLLHALDGLLTIHECLDLPYTESPAYPRSSPPRGRSDPGIRLPSTGQVTRVGSTQSRIGHTFSSSVRGDEVLQYVQTLTEVGLDRKLDRMTGRICHQSTHTSKLFDLLIRTTRSGVSHHEDVVVMIKTVQQCVSQLIIGCLPGLDNFLVTLFLCDKTTLEVLVILSTVSCAVSISSGLLGGTVISEIDTVMAARVENL